MGRYNLFVNGTEIVSNVSITQNIFNSTYIRFNGDTSYDGKFLVTCYYPGQSCKFFIWNLTVNAYELAL